MQKDPQKHQNSGYDSASTDVFIHVMITCIFLKQLRSAETFERHMTF